MGGLPALIVHEVCHTLTAPGLPSVPFIVTGHTAAGCQSLPSQQLLSENRVTRTPTLVTTPGLLKGWSAKVPEMAGRTEMTEPFAGETIPVNGGAVSKVTV